MRFDPGPGWAATACRSTPSTSPSRRASTTSTPSSSSWPARSTRPSPRFCVERIERALNEAGKPVKGSKILVLGVSYKAGVGDIRESPALKIVRLLRELGGEVSYHDPHVPELPELGLALGRSGEALAAPTRPRSSPPTPSSTTSAIVAAAPLVVDFRGVTRGIDAREPGPALRAGEHDAPPDRSRGCSRHCWSPRGGRSPSTLTSTASPAACARSSAPSCRRRCAAEAERAAAGTALGRLRIDLAPDPRRHPRPSFAVARIDPEFTFPSAARRCAPSAPPVVGRPQVGRPRLAREVEERLGEEVPLIVDGDGHVLEAGRANVFLVLDGALVTPPADSRILPGTARAATIELARELGSRVAERPIGPARRARGREVFLATSSVRGAGPRMQPRRAHPSARPGIYIANSLPRRCANVGSVDFFEPRALLLASRRPGRSASSRWSRRWP